MRLSVRISPVEPGVYELPERCPYRNCDGKHFRPHQNIVTRLSAIPSMRLWKRNATVV